MTNEHMTYIFIHTHILYSYTYTYTYTLNVLCFTINLEKICKLFIDGYKITMQGVV
jgi:hypothetical protein